MSKAHLIVGNVGAGKSTYATQLSAKIKGHVFTIDDWMTNLFHPDKPDPMTYEWALERVERCEHQILKETIDLLKLGTPIILDLGFFSEAQRTRVMDKLTAYSMNARIHYLDVDKDTRWMRVQQRNTEMGDTFKFEVSREVFDFCETIFEPLSHIEHEHAETLNWTTSQELKEWP